jgi:hypothetical protein
LFGDIGWRQEFGLIRANYPLNRRRSILGAKTANHLDYETRAPTMSSDINDETS